MKVDNNILNQGIGSYVQYINSVREEELRAILESIGNKLNGELKQQDKDLIEALKYVDKVKEFVANPDKILGSNLTKHGEIAEQIDVNIGNARLILNGLKEKFTFEGVGRTAPEDYLNGDQAVQAKFYNGINNTLKAVLEHKDKYKYFGSDGKSYYSIPKDYYETIEKIINGENVDNLNSRTVETAKRLISQIEDETGRPFNEVVKPGIGKYSDVQSGKVGETLKNEEESLKEQAKLNKKQSRETAKVDSSNAINDSGPSFSEGFKVAGSAAVVSGAISFAVAISKKKRDGISIVDFTAEDWKDVGIDTGKGTIKGGISGGAIYALTNLAKTPAPLASAYVSASFGIASLSKKHKDGEIETDEFIENSQLLCMESAVSAIGASLGSVIIPVPILGAVIGSIVANTMSTIGKEYLENKEKALIEEYNNKFMLEIGKMDREHLLILTQIMQEYYKLGDITAKAFDFNLNSNLRFNKSIELAKVHSVNENEILKTTDDIKSYFLD